jgi:hypothetical protein
MMGMGRRGMKFYMFAKETSFIADPADLREFGEI